MDPALRAFHDLLKAPDAAIDLSRAALAVARIEHPDLDDRRELTRLDELAGRVGVTRRTEPGVALERLRRFLFEEEGFRGNADEYYDPRNSCLNDVLDRKLGIPITLSVLTIEVGRRVGLDIAGVGLPGHFFVSANVGGQPVLQLDRAAFQEIHGILHQRAVLGFAHQPHARPRAALDLVEQARARAAGEGGIRA